MKSKLLATQLVLGVALSGSEGCLPSSSNILVGQVSNSQNTATLSKRNSGAMSKGSTLVSVRLNSVPDDDTHGPIVLGLTGDKPVEMKWIGPARLAISCAPCTPEDVNFEIVKDGDLIISYSDNLQVRP